MSYEMVKLGDICTFINGDRGKNYPSKGYFVDEGNPFISAGNLDNYLLDEESFNYITEEKYNSLSNGKINQGDIIFCLRGSLGKFAFVNTDIKGAIASSLVIIRTNLKLDVSYLNFYLRSTLCSREIEAFENGAAQPNLSARDLKKFLIPLPQIETQRKIVEILDKAQELIDKRKEQIKEMDSLVQSLFYDMFGDPVSNPMGWEQGYIKDLAIRTQYGSGKKADLTHGEFPMLRMNNILYSGGWDLSSLKYVDLDEVEKKKYLVHKGELLFNRTNSRELVGKTAVYRENTPVAYAGYLVKLITNERGNPEYISAYLNSKHGKLVLLNMAKNIVGMANINAEELKKIRINIPPIELQNTFANRVQDVEQQKKTIALSLKELEDNFNCLMQKAFKGELV